MSLDFGNHQPITKDEQQDAVSSNSSIDKIVDQGMQHTVDFIHKNQFNKAIPYAVSLLLSMSQNQLNKLNNSQNEDSNDSEPLVIASDFKKTLDAIQQDLFQNSLIWQLPRSLYIESRLEEELPSKGAIDKKL